ncbi:MAG: hypothetical protein ACRD2L_13620 [Terriglobia bacterium]
MTTFQLLFTDEAAEQLADLEKNQGRVKTLKAVRKALGLLQTNPRHPGLHSHKIKSIKAPHGEDLFEAYAESKTPAAYRIFWHYGPGGREITVVSIIPHP